MKKSIGFITEGLKINGDSIKETGVGGAESALIYMAHELARLGNQVTVYCNLLGEPKDYAGVSYKSADDYCLNRVDHFDVLIVSRFSEYFDYVLDSKLNIFWAHDVGSPHMAYVLGIADKIFFLSDYHKDIYVEQCRMKKQDIIYITSNGFDSNIIPRALDFDQKKNNFIYASRPERGLKFLLTDIWPKIVEKNPEAVLHVCSYNVNDIKISEEFYALYETIDQLLSSAKNVKNLGSLNKKDYYELLSKCAYMLYPTDFPEISCINAIEAQANECLVITSDLYALSKTVKTDTRIKETYGSSEYIAEFLSLIDRYQGDAYRQEVARGRQAIADYAWEKVARSWNDAIDGFFHTRNDQKKQRILENLVYHSDIVAAWKLTQDDQYRKLLNDLEHFNLNLDKISDLPSVPLTRNWDLFRLLEQRIDKDPGKKFKVLDLGSQNGVLSMPLLKKFAQYIDSVTMFDSSELALDYVKTHFCDQYSQIELVLDDLRNLKKYKFKPDIVIVGEVLEHIEDTKLFLDAVLDLAQENTLFYFTVPRGPWEFAFDKNKERPEHVHHFERSDIEQLFGNIKLTFGQQSNIKEQSLRGELLDNHVFWFELSKDDKVSLGEINYQDKFIKTRPYQRVSCCLLVKDVAPLIDSCLRSIKNHFDEIVIVDAGSTDDTKKLAGEHTKNIYDWSGPIDGIDGFVQARNFAMDQCTGDYVFWLEANENISNLNRLFKYINNGYYDSMALSCESSPKSYALQTRLIKSDLRAIKKDSSYRLSPDGTTVADNGLAFGSTVIKLANPEFKN